MTLTIPADPANPAAPAAPDHGPVNFMLLLYEAINKDQNGMAQQQIVDAESTKISVGFEEKIYSVWNQLLETDATNILNNPNQVQYYQSVYNTHSAEAQAGENDEDGTVQSQQGQTSSDAQNLQMKAQMVQGINSILTTLSGLLGRITA